MARAKRGIPLHGWINLDKPLGLSSAQAVAAVKRITNAQKAGHAGTLDPLASGILPIALGEATKTSTYLVDARKSYGFTLTFGSATTSGDAEGDVVMRSDYRPNASELLSIMPKFLGDITQTPPAFSAIKIDGKRAYALARAGEDVEIPARQVHIYELTLLSAGDSPLETADFTVTCSKGTYIRSLAQDLALAVNSCGHVTALRRLAVGKFTEINAISLDLLEQLVHSPAQSAGATLADYIMPLSAALDDIPARQISKTEATQLRQGQAIPVNEINAPLIATLHENQLIAICRQEDGHIKPVRVFNL